MTYDIYPNSTPEFRIFQKADGTMEMQVRYLNASMNSHRDSLNFMNRFIPVIDAA